ncbi:MAG: CBS domain-containing protein [Desulfotomaculaceae bacterium]|nr:CBS domain-containing protein [Desulfotomaculaceae bacterium]
MSKVITVGDVYQLITTEAKTIDENAPKQEVISVFLSGSNLTHCVYVVNSLGKLQGIITMNDIIDSIALKIGYTPRSLNVISVPKLFELSPFGTASDMMRAPVYVTEQSELQAALKKMADHNLSELPVTDEEGKVIGDLNAFEILKFI